MLLAMVDDIRVILVKLADRLHNMRTLSHLPDERRFKIAQETRDIYAPIANRLGMSKVKNELEELSFRYLEPQAYEQLRIKVDARRRQTEGLIEELKQTLTAKLTEAQVPVIQIDGRIKRLWSISQKLKRQKIELEQVYDFIALRVITEGVKECYAALGIIHQTWSPVPGRIKDFIAMPRPNGYQSLHTSVISEHGMPFEVQIRSIEMHRMAEEGIAAHWKYKEGRVGDRRDDRYFQWMRPAARIAAGGRDPQEFIQNLKVELYPEEVYTFTPKGPGEGAAQRRDAGRFRLRHPHRRRPSVRRGARQRQDGAAAHAAPQRRHRRNRHAGGAQAEPRLADVRGDVAGPQQDQASHSLGREDARHRTGAQAVRQGSAPLRPQSENDRRRRQLRPGAVGPRAGQGRRSVRGDRLRENQPKHVFVKLVPADKLHERPPDGAVASVVRRVFGSGEEKIKVRGFDDLMVFRARCCNPIRGEKIVGYITARQGRVRPFRHLSERRQPALRPRTPHRRRVGQGRGSVAAVSGASDDGSGEPQGAAGGGQHEDCGHQHQHQEHRGATGDDQRARIDMTVEISDLKHLEKVIKAVRGVEGVIGVERAGRAGGAG
jgi:GTP pyrophosphokinase